LTSQLIIIGFMGSGKSTVARVLALRLNRPMVDLDQLITSNEGRSPAEIIEQDGENHFRGIERQTLNEVLTAGVARIVSVGGGAWTIAENRRLITDHETFTVWLDAPFELCWRRIEAGREPRPLASSRELAEKLYRERRSDYALADARIPIAEPDRAEDIATKVVAAASRQNPSRPQKLPA
jgi:shikimate kinase